MPFKKELAVTVARTPDGEVKAYPVVEMEFHHEAEIPLETERAAYCCECYKTDEQKQEEADVSELATRTAEIAKLHELRAKYPDE